MHHRGDAPRRAASAAAGLGMGKQSGNNARETSSADAGLGLELLVPLALALGAGEVGTCAKAARQVHLLTRQGKVSCAAAAKTGTVLGLVALVTRVSHDTGDEIGENNTTNGDDADDDDTAHATLLCAADAADALAQLALSDSDGKQVVASAATMSSLLDAIVSMGNAVDAIKKKATTSTPATEDIETQVGTFEERTLSLPKGLSRARVSITRLVFAVASTTQARVSIAAHRGALSALSEWTSTDCAFTRSAEIAASAAGVLWIAATPPFPQSIPQNVSTAPDAAHRRTESGNADSASHGTSTTTFRKVTTSCFTEFDSGIATRAVSPLKNARPSAAGHRSAGGACGGGGGGGLVGHIPTANPRAAAAARDVADVLARRHLQALGSAVIANCWEKEFPSTGDASSMTKNTRDLFSTTRVRVFLTVASIAGRDAARAAAVSRETRLVHALVDSLHTKYALPTRTAAASALWVVVSGVLRKENFHVSPAAKAVIDLIVLDTDVVGFLSQCLSLDVTVADCTDGNDQETPYCLPTGHEKTQCEVLARLACATLGTLRESEKFEDKVLAPFAEGGVGSNTSTPIDLIVNFAIETVGTPSNLWAMWCLSEVTFESCRVTETVTNRRELSHQLERAAAAGGARGVCAARVLWNCLTVHGETNCSVDTEKRCNTGNTTPEHVHAFALGLLKRGGPTVPCETENVPEKGGKTRTEIGHRLARVLVSLIKRSGSASLDFVEIDGASEDDVGDAHTPMAGYDSWGDFSGVGASGFTSVGGGGVPGSVGKGIRFADRRRSRAQSGELLNWGSGSHLPEFALGSFTGGGGASDDESGGESFGTVVRHRSAGGRDDDFGGGDTERGFPFFEPQQKRASLGRDARRLAAAIVSAISVAVDDASGDDTSTGNTTSTSSSGGNTTSIAVLLLSGLPKLLVQCVCDGDGDEDCWEGTAGRERADAGAAPTTPNTPTPAKLKRTIHACAATAISKFLKVAADDVGTRSSDETLTPENSNPVMTDPGSGLLLAVAAVLGSRDAEASREVSSALGKAFETVDGKNNNAVPEEKQSLARTVCAFPGIVDGVLRAVRFGVCFESTTVYGHTVVGSGLQSLVAYDSRRDTRDARVVSSAAANEGDNFCADDDDRITVPLPATPKEGDGTDPAKGFLSPENAPGTQKVTPLDRLITLPSTSERDESESFGDESFVSAEHDGFEPDNIVSSVAARPRTTGPRSGPADHRFTGSSGNLSSLGSPRSALLLSPSGKRVGNTSGWQSMSGVQTDSPRPNGLGLRGSIGSIHSRRGSGFDFSQLQRDRAKCATFSSLCSRRTSAAVSLRTAASLVTCDVSGKCASKFANRRELCVSLRTALVAQNEFGTDRDRENENEKWDSEPDRNELRSAAASLLTALVKRGERDKVIGGVFFPEMDGGNGNGPLSGKGSRDDAALEPDSAISLAKTAHLVFDAILAVAVGAAASNSVCANRVGSCWNSYSPFDERQGNIKHAVDATSAFASIAPHSKIATSITTHEFVIPRLLALTAPPHDSRIAKHAANALSSVLLTCTPASGSDAAETVWSVDAIAVLVAAMRRALDGSEDGDGDYSRTKYALHDDDTDALLASASSARLFAITAATAEDDASRDDIAGEPGVLLTIDALLNWRVDKRAGNDTRRQSGLNQLKDGNSRVDTDAVKAGNRVTSAACFVVAELARTPSLLGVVRDELSVPKGRGGTNIISGLLNALDEWFERDGTETRELSAVSTDVTADVTSDVTVDVTSDVTVDVTSDVTTDVTADATTDVSVDLNMGGSTDSGVCAMCALSRFAGADREVAERLFNNKRFVGFVERAITGAARALSKPNGDSKTGGGHGHVLNSNNANHNQSDGNAHKFLVAAHAARALRAWVRTRATATISLKGAQVELSVKGAQVDLSLKSVAEVFTSRLRGDITLLVAGGVSVPENTHDWDDSVGTQGVQQESDKRLGTSRAAPQPWVPLLSAKQSPTNATRTHIAGDDALSESLRERRGAKTLRALAVDAFAFGGEGLVVGAPIPDQKLLCSDNNSRSRKTDDDAAAILVARLGAAHVLRELFSFSAPGAKEIDEKENERSDPGFQSTVRAFLELVRCGDRLEFSEQHVGASKQVSGKQSRSAQHAVGALCSALRRLGGEFLRDCLRVPKFSQAVSEIVAEGGIGAATALANAIRLLTPRSETPGGTHRKSLGGSGQQTVSSPRPGGPVSVNRDERGFPSFSKSSKKHAAPSKHDVLAATASLAILADVSRNHPRFVVQVAMMAGVGTDFFLRGFLDRKTFQAGCDTVGMTLTVTGDELKSSHSAELDAFFQLVLAPSRDLETNQEQHGDKPDAEKQVSDSRTHPQKSYDKKTSITRGGVGNARAVAAEIFAAIAAVGGSGFVLGIDLRVTESLAEVVGAGTPAVGSHYPFVHRTAAARALWSLALAEGDGACLVDSTPGVVASLASLVAGRNERFEKTHCDVADETNEKSDFFSARAAGAGALGAVFAGAAASSDRNRGVRCVADAFGVPGLARGLAEIVSGFDTNGTLAATAATAAATRVPRGAGFVAGSDTLVKALTVCLCTCVSFQDAGDDKSAVAKRDTHAHALDALANLAAHEESVTVMTRPGRDCSLNDSVSIAPKTSQARVWVAAVANLVASNRTSSRTTVTALNALRTFQQTALAVSGDTLRFVNGIVLETVTIETLAEVLAGGTTRGAQGEGNNSQGDEGGARCEGNAFRNTGVKKEGTPGGDQSEEQGNTQPLAARVAAAGVLSFLTRDAASCFSWKASDRDARVLNELDAIAVALRGAFQFVVNHAPPPVSLLEKQNLLVLNRVCSTTLRNVACALRLGGGKEDVESWSNPESLKALGQETEKETLSRHTSATSARVLVTLASAVTAAAQAWRSGKNTDSFAVANVTEALALVARSVGAIFGDAKESDSLEKLKLALREAATAAAPALVVAVCERETSGADRSQTPSPGRQLNVETAGFISNKKSTLAHGASSAIAALADAGSVCVAPFLDDATRRDELLDALASGVGVGKQSDDEDDDDATNSTGTSTANAFVSTLHALSGTSKQWAVCVTKHAFDVLLDTVRRANKREFGAKEEPSLDASSSIVAPDDVDVLFSANHKTHQTKWHSTGAVASSALRRLLDFGVLDESQTLALLSPSFGVLDGVGDFLEDVVGFSETKNGALARRFVTQEKSTQKSRNCKTPARVARFILDGKMSCVNDVCDVNETQTTRSGITTPLTNYAYVMRTLLALASASPTAARIVGVTFFSSKDGKKSILQSRSGGLTATAFSVTEAEVFGLVARASKSARRELLSEKYGVVEGLRLMRQKSASDAEAGKAAERALVGLGVEG